MEDSTSNKESDTERKGESPESGESAMGIDQVTIPIKVWEEVNGLINNTVKENKEIAAENRRLCQELSKAVAQIEKLETRSETASAPGTGNQPTTTTASAWGNRKNTLEEGLAQGQQKMTANGPGISAHSPASSQDPAKETKLN